MSVYSINFPNNSPDGVFILSNNTSPVIFLYIPRGKIKDAAAIEELHDKTRGVYILYGKGEIYVGQSTRVIDRIKEHEIGKDFWECALLMLAPPQNFKIDIIHCVEALAIERFKRDGRFKVTNTQEPNCTPSSCSESYDAMIFLDNFWFFTNFILGLSQCQKITDMTATKSEVDDQKHDTTDTTELGKAIENSSSETSSSSPQPQTDSAQDKALEQIVFWLKKKRKNLAAQMVVRNGEYVVLKGSHIDLDIPINYGKGPKYEKINQDCNNMRQQLLLEGAIIRDDSGRYVLNVNQAFDAPSSAAVFVAGSNHNGKEVWKSPDGRQLKEFPDNTATKKKSK